MGFDRATKDPVTRRRRDQAATPNDPQRAGRESFAGVGNLDVQRSLKGASPETEADHMAEDVLRDSPGDLRAAFGERYGVDLSGVRVHDGPAAHDAARAKDARAFTEGKDITLGAGEVTRDADGQRLLAHELAHVVQQTKSGERAVQREPKQKSDGPDRAVNRRRVSMTFDGKNLIVLADGEEKFRFTANSGRPLLVRPEDLKSCGGDQRTDSYLNNPRYAGIKDYGPIPEGRYTFSPGTMQRFTFGEELWHIETHGHEHHYKAGSGDITGGDWGAGRVALNPQRIVPTTCGKSTQRDAFFLHGGWFAGSSGCIDIGTSFDELADWLTGFTGAIAIDVHYTEDPTSVGYFTGLGGVVAYEVFNNAPVNLSHGPRVGVGAEFQQPTGKPADSRLLLSADYSGILRWAGGALVAGVRLDVPLDDKEQFVRLGLQVDTNFRVFRALYGTLSGGYMQALGDKTQTSGGFVGGGLGYDFGRVHLEAVYDVLEPASQDQRVNQALLRIGINL
ncbi:MAG: DUF4157 domain-containing protein [Deltaproteobacteria bacterium]